MFASSSSSSLAGALGGIDGKQSRLREFREASHKDNKGDRTEVSRDQGRKAGRRKSRAWFDHQ